MKIAVSEFNPLVREAHTSRKTRGHLQRHSVCLRGGTAGAGPSVGAGRFVVSAARARAPRAGVRGLRKGRHSPDAAADPELRPQSQTPPASLESVHSSLSAPHVQWAASREVEGGPTWEYGELYRVSRHMVSYHHDSHLLLVNFMQMLVDFQRQINNDGPMADIYISFTGGWAWGFAPRDP